MQNEVVNGEAVDSATKPVLKLVGEDGNAFSILGRASRVAKKAGLDWSAIQKEAMASDYDHLLRTMMKYFDVA